MAIRFNAALALLTLLLAAHPARAQGADAEGFFGGGALLGGIPVGDFGEELDAMFGAGAHLVYRVDDDGTFGVRLGADWLLYGSDERDVTLVSPLGGVEGVELTNTHSAVFVGIGPEVSIGLSGARPYLGGSIGLAYFITDLVADWDEDDDNLRFTTNVQYDDWALAYGGQAGILIPITSGDWAVSVDFGARYQGSGEISFVDEDGLDIELGRIVLDPVTENTSLWILRAGVSIALGDDD